MSDARNTRAISADEPTLPGTVTRTTRNGTQTYIRVAIEPYTNRNGRETKLIVWRSTCRECGATFYATSCASKAAIGGKLMPVHCPDHRLHTKWRQSARTIPKQPNSHACKA